MATAVPNKKPQTPRERFLSAANRRTNKAIIAIKSIGQLANADTYQNTPQDVAKIVSALNAAIANVEKRFQNPKHQDAGFSL